MQAPQKNRFIACAALSAVLFLALPLPAAARQGVDTRQPATTYTVGNAQELQDLLANPLAETITLGADITLNEPLVIGRTLTIESAGSAEGAVFTLSAPAATAQKHHFILQPGASLTAAGIVLEGNDAGGGAYVPTGSALTLRNATVQNMRDTSNGAVPYLFYTDGGEIAIHDSVFTSNSVAGCVAPVMGANGARIVVQRSGFTNNKSEYTYSSDGVFPAGVFSVAGGTSLQIEAAYFTGNDCARGPGSIYADGNGTDIHIINTSFVGNVSQVDNLAGGAVRVNYGAVLYAEDCLFENNTGGVGGAIGGYSSTITLEGCELYGNKAVSGAMGGAICLLSPPGYGKASLTLSNTWVGGHNPLQGNRADAEDGGLSGGQGGGVNFQGDELSITGCYFINNAAVGGAGGGGGLYAEFLQTLTIENTLFEGNTATNTNGGAAALVSSVTNTVVKDSAFISNQCVADEKAIHDNYGAALLLFDAPADIVDCEFTANSYLHSADAAAQPFGGGALTAYYSPTAITGSGFTDNYSDTDGGAIFVNEYTALTLEDVAFQGNFAQNGGFAVTEDDTHLISAHTSQFSGTNSFSYPFSIVSGGLYGYNNYDINYINTLTTPTPVQRLNANFYDTDGESLLLRQYAYTGVPYSLPAPAAGFDTPDKITGRIFLGWQEGSATYQPGAKILPAGSDFALTALARQGCDVVELESTVSSGEAKPGEDLEYTIRITNAGDYIWEGSATAYLPAQLTDARDISASNPSLASKLAVSGTQVSATGLYLQSGQSITIKYTATVADDAQEDESIVHTAKATGNGALGLAEATAQTLTTVLAKPPVEPSSKEPDPSDTDSGNTGNSTSPGGSTGSSSGGASIPGPSGPSSNNPGPSYPGSGGQPSSDRGSGGPSTSTSGLASPAPSTSNPASGGFGASGGSMPSQHARSSSHGSVGQNGSSAARQSSQPNGISGSAGVGAGSTREPGAVASTGEGPVTPWLVLAVLSATAMMALLYTRRRT